MNKKQQARQERLLPAGIPRYVRCYDNGGSDHAWKFKGEIHHGTCDRYTAIYAGKYRGKGWFQYVSMSGAPFHPQGVGMHGEHPTQVDAPYGFPPAIGRSCHLGKRIPFTDLPEDCQKLVLHGYKEIWGLTSQA